MLRYINSSPAPSRIGKADPETTAKATAPPMAMVLYCHFAASFTKLICPSSFSSGIRPLPVSDLVPGRGAERRARAAACRGTLSSASWRLHEAGRMEPADPLRLYRVRRTLYKCGRPGKSPHPRHG